MGSDEAFPRVIPPVPMNTYDIWFDHEEQWDPEDIDPPRATISAPNVEAAAMKFAEQEDCEFRTALIVRDATDAYYMITLYRQWEVTAQRRTSLKELSDS